MRTVRNWVAGYAAIILIHFALTLPALLGLGKSGIAYDEATFHVPTIKKILEAWPYLHITDVSLSATSPGYHYFIASISHLFGHSLLSYRLINNLVSLCLPLALYQSANRRLSPITATFVVAPLLTSSFYVKSASVVLTDNAALLFTTLSMLALIEFTDGRPATLRCGLTAALATAVRQLNVWLVGPMLLRFIIDQASLRAEPPVSRASIGTGRITLAIAGMSLPILVVTALFASWGGLLPAHWRTTSQSARISAAPLSYVLGLMAIFGLFYVGAIFDAKGIARCTRPLFVGAVIGALVSVLSPTTYDANAGRWGGYLWSAAHYLPAWSARSSVFLLLCPIGGAILALLAAELWNSAGRSQALIWLVAVVAWSSTGLVNRQIFQRYYEPFVIIMLIIAVVELLSRWNQAAYSVRHYILGACSCIQLIVTVFTVYQWG
ncbi:MAG: glycosyltransferase family 39 protein [Acidobacteriota bacterium]